MNATTANLNSERVTHSVGEVTGSEWPTLTLKEAQVTLIDCDHRTPPAADDGYPYVARLLMPD
jgi:hypothetical protein